MDSTIDFSELYPHNPSLVEEMERLFRNYTKPPAVAQPKSDVQSPDQTTFFPESFFNINANDGYSDLSIDDILAEFRQNGVDKEYCPDLMSSAVIKTKTKKIVLQECVFCRNNGEVKEFYKKHVLKDKHDKIVCPVLRAYTCPICGANGDFAHTIKYCPQNNNSADVPSTVMALRTPRTATGKKRRTSFRE